MSTTKTRSRAAARPSRAPAATLAEGIHLVRWSDTPDTLRVVFGANVKQRTRVGGDPVDFELGDVPLPGTKVTLRCDRCTAASTGVLALELSHAIDEPEGIEDWRSMLAVPVARWFEALGVKLPKGVSLATLDQHVSEGEVVDCPAPFGVRVGVSLVWDPPTFSVSILAPDYEARLARARRGPLDAMLKEARAATTPRARSEALRTFERKALSDGPSAIDDDGLRAWLVEILAEAPNADFARRAAMLLVGHTSLDRLGPRLAAFPIDGTGATALLSALFGHYFAAPRLDPAMRDWLLRAASSSQARMREATAPILAKLGEEGVAVLQKLLRDGAKSVRVAAMYGLRYAPARIAVDAARDALRTPALEVDETAVSVLTDFAKVENEARDDARQALRDALTHGTLEARAGAALALLALDPKDAAAFPVIDAIVSDPRGRVETRTHWLQELNIRMPLTPKKRALLQRLSRDKNTTVRNQAKAHLAASRKKR